MTEAITNLFQPNEVIPHGEAIITALFQADDVILLHGEIQVAPQGALVRATNDAEAVKAWLGNFNDSPRTLINYRKEAERLLLWARMRGISLSGLRHEDFIEFREFLAHPPEAWVSKAKHPRKDNRWRPFSTSLTEASVKQALLTCNGMLNWLVKSKYLQANPLALSRNRRGGKTKRLTRFLSGHQVEEILRTVDAIEDPRHRARCRWVFTLLYLTMGRISEAIGATMGDFYRAPSRHGTVWWLHVIGKGNKEGDIPVTDELLDELKAYRVANGLPALPEMDDKTPIILRVEGDRSRPMTQSMLHKIIKQVVGDTADRLELAGKDADAQVIRKASAHWFRHSAASALASHVDMPSLRDIMRHENVATTSIYSHTEKDKLHDLMQQHHKLPSNT